MNRKAYYVIARDFNHDGVIKGKMIFTDINNKFINYFYVFLIITLILKIWNNI